MLALLLALAMDMDRMCLVPDGSVSVRAGWVNTMDCPPDSLPMKERKGDNLGLSFAMYAFGASADELTSHREGVQEVGLIRDPALRVTAKVVGLLVYMGVTHAASKSDTKRYRVAGKILRYVVPAMYVGAALHNVRQK